MFKKSCQSCAYFQLAKFAAATAYRSITFQWPELALSAQKTLIQAIKPAIESLLITLAKACMKTEFVDEYAKRIYDLDHLNSDEFVPLDLVYLGEWRDICFVCFYSPWLDPSLTIRSFRSLFLFIGLSASETMLEITRMPLVELMKTVFFSKEKTEADQRVAEESQKILSVCPRVRVHLLTKRDTRNVVKLHIISPLKTNFSQKIFFFDPFKRFDLTDDLYEFFSSLLQPKNARALNPPSLACVFKRFPQLEESCDKQKAQLVWRHHALYLSEFKVSNVDDLFRMWSRNTGNLFLFPLIRAISQFFLTVCISLLLCLP